jgi:hypothetical protein
MLNYGMAHNNDPVMLKASTVAFEDLIARQLYNDPFVFKRLGLAYSKLALREPENLDKMRAIWKRYLEVAPAEDPDLGEIRKAVNGSR